MTLSGQSCKDLSVPTVPLRPLLAHVEDCLAPVLEAAIAMGLSLDDMTGGMIGVFMAAHVTSTAELGGCQVERGAGSGMAAALVTLTNCALSQAMALQNIFGMVYDTVTNRIEMPCLDKNVMAASNALGCTNMALANFDPVIPLDEVINTMDKVGKILPVELRHSTLGALSITQTSKEIEKKLKKSH